MADFFENMKLFVGNGAYVVWAGGTEFLHEVVHSFDEGEFINFNVGGDGEGGQDSGYGGMYARHEEGEPKATDAEDAVPEYAAYTQDVRNNHGGHEDAAGEEAGEVDVGSIEEGDDEDGTEVIGNGEGGEEDFEGKGDFVAQEVENTEGEGDVGSHGDTPSFRGVFGVVEEEVNGSGENHTANGAGDREERFAGFVELASDDFAFEFEADHEEEYGHEPVINPMVEGFFDIKLVKAKAELVFP